ncbi:MAG TPA: ubiquinol-cytochrome c reductase cytochrome b subunit [Acidimicrobiales bacterium]|nr:ubiquinol-cytochrome c reductase cytochrome b subunit [Acidimicrobiales bacterium]
MVERLARWIDNRLGASAFTRQALNKVFPDHWSFMFGEIALYSLVVLIVTGVFLTFFFDPSVSETVYEGKYEPLRGVRMSDAYRSALELSFDVRAGLLMRQAHHWAAIVFIASIVVHLIRVFFTGAFRRPREINWIVGVTLLVLAIFNGFTGYSLPDDLLSGTGLRITYALALSVPFLGTWLAFLIFGGEFPAEQIIPRLFVTHIMIVPALLIGLIAVHLAIIWRQKHTDFDGPGRRESNVVGSRLWPTYAVKSLALFFAVAAVLFAMGGLVQINPVWLYGPFRIADVPSPAQPDWWLGWVEGALRIFPPWEIRAFGYEIPNPFYPGILLPTVTFVLLYAWPFLEARLTGDRGPHHLLDRARDHPVRTALGVTTLTYYVVLQLAASNDLIAKWFYVSVAAITWIFRVLVLVVPPALGYFTYRLMRGLQLSGAERIGEVPLAAVIGRSRGEEEAEAEPREALRGEEPVPSGRLEVTQGPDGRWCWTYQEPDVDLELFGNNSFATREEALASAAEAYPDAPVAAAVERVQDQ